MKPRDSSDEEHDLAGEVRGEPSNWAVAPGLPPGGSARSVSGVVAAPGPQVSAADEDDEATTVGPGSHPLPEEEQAALSRRIRTALGQTLPLGTPAPGATAGRGLRSAFARTMILGGRQSPGILSEAPPLPARARSAEPADAALRPESVTPSAPASAPPFPAAEPAERPRSDREALRASFVRPVGMPTVPPPRRSRRSGAGEPNPAESEGPLSESDHEAFALDRPLTTTGAFGLRPSGIPAAGEARVGVSPSRGESASRNLGTGVMLPPPPQPADYEPASSPVFPPLEPRGGELPTGHSVATAASAPRAPAPVLLTDLPSANPFEGFEAPRETFAQRSLIVFVVALAVVGLFALAAMAFGFLGKTGW